MPPEFCPNCGAEVPPRASACPECGSDYQTGWSDRADADRLGLPDEEFDYNEFVEQEFGGKDPGRKRVPWLWWIIAGLLVIAFVLWWLF